MFTYEMDNRAQAIGIFRLFASLGVGAVIIWILSEVTSPLFAHVDDQTQPGGVAATGTGYLQEGVAFVPLLFLLVGFFGLVAYSVYSREVLR